jgi:hypothetical protein
MLTKTLGTVNAETQKAMSGLESVQGLVSGTLPLNMIARTLGYDVIEVAKGPVAVAVKPGCMVVSLPRYSTAAWARRPVDTRQGFWVDHG